MPYTKAQLEAQYEKLPDVLKDAIFSVEIAEKMFEIGKKHGITMEKTGFAAEETGFVILGLLPPREFAPSLAKRLDIDADKATAIASDISHQIFFPLREALKETHQIDAGESAIRNEEILPRKVVATAPAVPETLTAPIATAPKAPAMTPPLTTLPALPPTQDIVPPRVLTKMPALPSAPTPISVPPHNIIPQKPTDIIKPSAPIPAPAPAAPKIIPPISPPPPQPTTSKPTPITLAPLTPVPQPSIAPPLPQKPASEKASEVPKAAEQKKSPPIVLRPKFIPPFQENPAVLPRGSSQEDDSSHGARYPAERAEFTDDLQKEIAPLIGGMSTSAPRSFLTREQTEKFVAEKLAERKKLAPKDPMFPEAQKPLAPSATPQAPEPIKLAPLAGTPAPTPSANLPLGTAKVPALDLRNAPKPPPPKTYDGFDPYKEPVE